MNNRATPILGLLFAAGTQAFSQLSVLDFSFKVGAGANDTVSAVVVQSDQRILVGGEFTTINGCSNSYLAHLNADGTVDTSFNPAGQTDGAIASLLPQPDGKVLVSGSFEQLRGQPRRRLARLLADGSVDGTFDTGGLFNTNDWLFSLALQADGRVLVGYNSRQEGGAARVVRLNTNGAPDSTFICTNVATSYLFALLPLPDGSVLCGGNPLMYPSDLHSILFRLKPNGEPDDTFDPRLDSSSVFCLLRQANGQILVGGHLRRAGASNSVPLLRLNADLQWDDTFQTDLFAVSGGNWPPTVYSLLPQPDGKLIVGGFFDEVGGYWRRHVVRLTVEGHVDGCFDSGLGVINSSQPAPVIGMALQADGRIVIGGCFQGIDTAWEQGNLGRLLPQSDCDLIRVYLKGGESPFVAATFPPGGTNSLEASEDLQNWLPLIGNGTHPLVYNPLYSITSMPPAFFRARQAR